MLNTPERSNEACNYISQFAWDNKTFGQYKLHKLLYYEIKECFDLTAQMAVRCIAKVADAYKLDRKTMRRFKKRGGIAYDDRILRYLSDRVSIWTVAGHLHIPFVAAPRQLELLKFRKGESDLIYYCGKFYLNAVCEIDEPPPQDTDEFLGIDLGIVNIATDSDGETFAGGKLNNLRKRYFKLRQKLQSKGTKSAKRLLKKRSRKEKRFARDVNHCISKGIVAKAQGTGRGIALEDLKGIRERTTVSPSWPTGQGRAQRRRHNSWGFHQLRQFIEYKAKLAGVVVKIVDPRNTSRTCPMCGCIGEG